MNILCLPFSYLTGKNAELTAALISDMIKQIPQLGKVDDKYFVINTTLTINNPSNLRHIADFNVFLQLAASRQYNAVYLTK